LPAISTSTFSPRLFWCLALLAAGCAGSSVPRLSEDYRRRSLPGTGPYTWNEESGWLMPERGSWGTAEQLRAEARRAFEAGAHADALAGFLALRRLQDRAPEAAAGPGAPEKETNFFIGECYYQLGNYERALEHFRETYRKDFPATSMVLQAQERVYEIGMAYLQRKVPCSFLGVIHYACAQYGIEILAGREGGLITENPHLPFADDALIEIARHYFESKEYPESVPLYDQVARDDQSEWRDLAEYQAALAVFRQVRGVDYDQRTLLEAEKRFTNYLERNRRGDHVEEARRKLHEISEMEGAKYLRIAKFYLRENQPRACEIYLRRVLVNHPNSSAAREAREIQAQLNRLGEG
jgi:tetratricopeptide (TPR) repeat protein